jgi:hypothetical protein
VTRAGGKGWTGGKGWIALLAVFLLMPGARSILDAQIEMPDPKQMSGIPRPVTDLPNGSLSVRLIKGDLSNNIAGHPVALHIGDKVQTVNTDDAGRAQFDNLPAGSTLKAVAVVDGETLESQEFPSPVQGGIRLMLVATDKEKEAQKAAEANAPAITGQVVLGGDSRIVIEPGDETLSVFYILEIVNTARAPVNPPAVFQFDMPTGTTRANILQGSTKQASTTGTHVRVTGPFPPGKTLLQVGGDIPITSGTIDVTQRFPASFQQPVVIVKKEGAMSVTSVQLNRQQETTSEGTPIIVAAGDMVAADQPITVTISGLLHQNPTPLRATLIVAVLVALGGAWAFFKSADPESRGGERKKLIARREKLFQDLVRLEQDHRRGKVDAARYATRREELIASLEHVYGALDTEEATVDAKDRVGVGAPARQLGTS